MSSWSLVGCPLHASGWRRLLKDDKAIGARRVRRGRKLSDGHRTADYWQSGSRMVNREPLPGSLSTWIVPPCPSRILRVVGNPSPLPDGRVEKNASKIRERTSSVI